MSQSCHLLDTNAYAAFRRGDPAVLQVIHQSRRLYLSSIVIGELLFGFRLGNRPDENRRHLQEFMESSFVEQLAVTATTATHYARLAESLRRKGKPVPTNDIWIAAHAMEFGAQVLTYDLHFEQMDDVDVHRLIASE